MNESPFQPFRVLASAARTVTTYGPILKRPRGATGLAYWVNVTAITTTSLQLKGKCGMDAAKVGPDSSASSLGAALTTVTSAANLTATTSVVGAPVAQLYVTHSDANACTYEVWACWTGPEK